jgi:hypothetical protein
MVYLTMDPITFFITFCNNNVSELLAVHIKLVYVNN